MYPAQLMMQLIPYHKQNHPNTQVYILPIQHQQRVSIKEDFIFPYKKKIKWTLAELLTTSIALYNVLHTRWAPKYTVPDSSRLHTIKKKKKIQLVPEQLSIR